MIGIFDSGIGGLTVVKELFKQLPEYKIIYFGDTARTPYGNKSEQTIIKYAKEDADFLLSKGATIIVIACNTASAVASDELKKSYQKIPIFEVITPSINKALEITKNNRIGVIGTRATINSNIYQKKAQNINKNITIIGKPCPLLVPLTEENWLKNPETKTIIRKYLLPIKEAQVDSLILGCTHYPILKHIIKARVGKRITLIDPAEQTALQIKKYLSKNPDLEKNLTKDNQHEFYFSDIAPHLSQLAQSWLGQNITLNHHQI